MDLKKLGNFLNSKQVAFNKYKYQKKIYYFALQVILVFILMGLAVEGTAWVGYGELYGVTNAEQIKGNYVQAQALSKKVQKSITEVKQVRDDNVPVMAILAMLSSHKPEGMTISSFNIDPNKIDINGETKDVGSITAFASTLENKRFPHVQVDKIDQKEDATSFHIVMAKAKPAAKSAPEKGVASK